MILSMLAIIECTVRCPIHIPYLLYDSEAEVGQFTWSWTSLVAKDRIRKFRSR